MKKVLFVSHLGNFVKFNRIYMRWFREQGWTVHYASLDEEPIPDCDEHFKIDFNRSPFSKDNIRAYHQLKNLMAEQRYDLVHCHTPVGGVIARLAANATKTAPVIYTAHGFHFYKGGPFINNLIYKNIERVMAHFTDALVTINKEDFEAASKFHTRKGGKVYLMPGVGVDTERIRLTQADNDVIKKSLGMPNNWPVIITVAELIKRKNYETAVRAFAAMKNKNCYYLVCGMGELLDNIKQLTQELHCNERVIFCGYRRDIPKIVHIADIFLFTTFQEGLPISPLEAMAAGVPVVASNIRGVTEFAVEGETGFLCEPTDVESFAMALDKLVEDDNLRKAMGENCRKVSQRFSNENALSEMSKIYRENYRCVL